VGEGRSPKKQGGEFPIRGGLLFKEKGKNGKKRGRENIRVDVVPGGEGNYEPETSRIWKAPLEVVSFERKKGGNGKKRKKGRRGPN